jgi:Holliday junction resolvase RusA-like endonuclease
MMHFTIPGADIPALNGNKVYAANRWVRAKRAIAAHDVVRGCIWQQTGGKPEPFSAPVVVTISVYSHQPPDVDSVVKLTLDGIVWAGVLVDDGPDYVPDMVLRVRRCKRKDARIEVEIREV